MMFCELETAVTGGWEVFYKNTNNKVITDEKMPFSFPYSKYAVRCADGSLIYIAEYEGVETNFFVGEG